MSITRTGTVQGVQAPVTPAITQTGSASITIPVGAQIVFVTVATYHNPASVLRNAILKINNVAMTISPTPADASASYYQGVTWYMVNPPTGTQTLSWDWGYTPTNPDAPNMAVVCYTGIDTSAPIRDTDGVQGNGTVSTKALSVQSGDLVVCFAFHYNIEGTSETFTWTNATAVQGIPAGSAANIAATSNLSAATLDLAEASPGSGTLVVTVNPGRTDDGGLSALVLKPAGSASVAGTRLALTGVGV